MREEKMKYAATRFCQWFFLFIFASLLVGPTQALAQGTQGAIAGTVTDPSGAVLKGAQVSIPAQDLNVVSDDQGLFVIKGLAPGNYALRITYVGFAPFEKDTVTVDAGKTTNVAAELKVGSASQDVLVTAPRAGAEAEAINVQRTADNIVQVLRLKSSEACRTRTWRTRWVDCPASLWSAMRARGNMFRSAEPSRD
jgi:hypothetical protein